LKKEEVPLTWSEEYLNHLDKLNSHTQYRNYRKKLGVQLEQLASKGLIELMKRINEVVIEAFDDDTEYFLKGAFIDLIASFLDLDIKKPKYLKQSRFQKFLDPNFEQKFTLMTSHKIFLIKKITIYTLQKKLTQIVYLLYDEKPAFKKDHPKFFINMKKSWITPELKKAKKNIMGLNPLLAIPVEKGSEKAVDKDAILLETFVEKSNLLKQALAPIINDLETQGKFYSKCNKLFEAYKSKYLAMNEHDKLKKEHQERGLNNLYKEMVTDLENGISEIGILEELDELE
jgi:hypothetical protein